MSKNSKSNTREAVDNEIEQVGDDQVEESLQTSATEEAPAQPEPVPVSVEEVAAPKGVGGSYRINENGVRVKVQE